MPTTAPIPQPTYNFKEVTDKKAVVTKQKGVIDQQIGSLKKPQTGGELRSNNGQTQAELLAQLTAVNASIAALDAILAHLGHGDRWNGSEWIIA